MVGSDISRRAAPAGRPINSSQEVCQCFLGTTSHLDLFCQFFCIRPQMSSSGVRDLGGVSIQLWPISPFFPMELPRSMGSWHKKCFYVIGFEDSLPTFFGGSLTRLNSWESPKNLPKDVELLMIAAARIKERGLKGVHITQTWVEHRVLPLQAQNELMCNYRGPTDPSRVSPNELEGKEVRHWLAFLMVQEADKISLEVAVEAFHHDAPPGEVIFFAWFRLEREKRLFLDSDPLNS